METKCVHICYGYGKGKSTSAAGLALRAMGTGMRVLVVQFLKDGSSAELNMLKAAGADVLFTECNGFFGFMSPEEQANCKARQLSLLEKATSLIPEYDMVVLDEILDLADTGIVSSAVIEGIMQNPAAELVLTGHKMRDSLAEHADYITHFDCKKHPYDCKNLPPRRGIEF